MGPVPLHGADGVVDQQHRHVIGHGGRVVGQDGPGAVGHGVGRVVVAVTALGAHGHEQVTVLDQARIEAEAGVPAVVAGPPDLEARVGGDQVVEVDHR